MGWRLATFEESVSLFWSCGIQAGCDAFLLVGIALLQLIILRARFWPGGRLGLSDLLFILDGSQP